jgi:putative ABC transport system permease protein
MVIHFLKVGYRNAVRSKLFTFVNLTGLSLGIGAAFLLFVHVRQELNYETHIQDYQLIYRLSTAQWAKTAPPTAGQIKQEFGEIKHIARLQQMNQVTMVAGDVTVFPAFNYLADQSIIDVLNIPMAKGNPATALGDMNSIVITEQLASQLFKSWEDPMGKEIIINGYQRYVVSGVMKDQPRSTHLKIDCMVSLRQSSAVESTSKTWRAVGTYIRFNTISDAVAVQAKLRDFEYRFYDGVKTKEEIDRNADYFELEPIASIHLHSHKEKEAEANSDMMYIYVFSTFGILIVLIASINFVNLFTAQAFRRMKEIGIRKAIGAGKVQLAFQFLGEASIMVIISGIIGVAGAWMALPYYNELASISISAAELLSTKHLLVLAVVTAITALLSGAYPAISIAANAANIQATGKTVVHSGASFLSKSLVSVQFVISMFLLIVAVVAYSQLNFVHSKDLGFSKSQVVAVKLYGKLWVEATEHRDALRTELLKNPHVTDISLTDRIVGERFGFEGLHLLDKPDDEVIDARHVLVDERYLQTMGIELIDGNNFTGEPDSIPAYILNESAARKANIDNVIGRAAKNVAQDSPPGRIIGIVKDFNFASLHTAIDPLVLEFNRQYPDYMLVRIDHADIPGALKHLEETLKKAAPGTVVSYSFLDDKMETLYFKDYSLFRVTQIFSIVTVIVAVLGLFALSAQAAESRTKEVGIRKVLGATTRQVVGLFTSDFIFMIIVSLAIAIPGAWYASRVWLQGFYQRIDLHWLMFATPVMLIGMLAMCAVAIQAWRVARENPAKSLKYE